MTFNYELLPHISYLQDHGFLYTHLIHISKTRLPLIHITAGNTLLFEILKQAKITIQRGTKEILTLYFS